MRKRETSERETALPISKKPGNRGSTPRGSIMDCSTCETRKECSREPTESCGENGRGRYRNAKEAWEAVGFNVFGGLSHEEIHALKSSIAEKLDRLEPSEYALFCTMANNELRIRWGVIPQSGGYSLEGIINLPDWYETCRRIVTAKKPSRFWGSVGLGGYFTNKYLEKRAEQEELAIMMFECQVREFISFVKSSS